MCLRIDNYMDKNKSITDKLLAIEEDPQILDYQTTDGIPVWMMGRYYILVLVLGAKLMNYKSPVRNQRVTGEMLPTLLKTFMYNINHQDLKKGNKIIFYVPNRKTLIQGKHFNRYADSMAQVYESETVTIEQVMQDWVWPFPRVNNRVYFDTLGRVVGEIYGRFSKYACQKDYFTISECISFVNDKINNLFGFKLSDTETTEIVNYIAKHTATMRYQAEWLERQLTNETKVVITIGAGFPYYYPFNRMLKRHNVISCELQHGYITSNNMMYNYSPNIVNERVLIEGMPDYFLTYGDFWNLQMNCPVEKISIGNPYHDKCLKVIKERASKAKYITVLGTDSNTEEYLKITSFIMKNISGLQVIFRPHPGEKSRAQDLVRMKYPEVQLDQNDEIYDTLSQSYAIISEITTVLFEAIGIVERILVWNTPKSLELLPVHPFESFSTKEELIIKISSKKGLNDIDDNCFWKQDWEDGFKTFIENILK